LSYGEALSSMSRARMWGPICWGWACLRKWRRAAFMASGLSLKAMSSYNIWNPPW